MGGRGWKHGPINTEYMRQCRAARRVSNSLHRAAAINRKTEAMIVAVSPKEGETYASESQKSGK